MIYDSSTDFLAQLGAGQRLMALDLGKKRIGIAISDELRMVASGIENYTRSKFMADAAHIHALAQERNIGGIVIGLPLEMDGSEGKMCQSVRQFARNYLKEYTIPIIFWDERFSSSVVEKVMIEADLSRERRAQVRDKQAATYFLQGFLDSNSAD